MTPLNFNDVQVGDALPAFETEPISRLTLALYCGASGDHNPIHVDSDFAKAAGQSDVFAHGMLSMAYLGQLLTHWVPQNALREYGVRFVALTQVGAKLNCRGSVTEKRVSASGEKQVRVELSTQDQHGQVKLAGEALIALP